MDFSCVFCKETDFREMYPVPDIFGDTWKLCHCNNCEAYFLSPIPNETILARAYNDSYYGEGEEKFEGLFEKVLDKFKRHRAAVLAKALPPYARVLDIGCGNGHFLHSLVKLGKFELHGLEMPGNSAERAGRIQEINLHIGALEDGLYHKNYFHAITLFHVFEHLTEPADYLEIIRKILKPGGLLIMAFPNIDSLQSHLFKGRWLHLDPPRHLFFFSPTEFKKKMRAYGYTIVKENHISFEQGPFGFQQSLLNILTNRRELLFESMKGNKRYLSGYPRWKLSIQKLFFYTTFPFFAFTELLVSAFSRGAAVFFVLRRDE
jgi:2-polyprenyl-3-methyl-5-hydroxy-6-metoxy-1,4-benzoquinol methylase